MVEPDIALSLNRVTKSYPGVEALKDISFQVRRGSIHAFLGPNGAGKSTTMKILTGLIPATSGEVRVSGKIGFLPENPPLYLGMKVKDYLTFTAKIQTLEGTQAWDLADLLEKTGLTGVADRMIGNLSKGYRQRVGIAQALGANPSILILDEPTVGLDPEAMDEILKLIASLQDDHTILLSSHQLHEVEQICQDVTIVQKGRVVSSGEIERIQKQFQTTQVFEAKVKNWNADWGQSLKKSEGVSVEEHQKSATGERRLILTTNKKEDQRAQIVRRLVEFDAGLLEFVEIRPDLEDIFRQVTRQGELS